MGEAFFLSKYASAEDFRMVSIEPREEHFLRKGGKGGGRRKRRKQGRCVGVGVPASRWMGLGGDECFVQNKESAESPKGFARTVERRRTLHPVPARNNASS